MTIAPNDTVYLVLWFKEGLATPIYSYDVRESSSVEPKHWWDADLLGSRSYFNAQTRPSHLLLRHVAADDAGMYKCRVDFQREPTRNSRVNLTVIMPPKDIQILDNSGRKITSFIGPINEKSDLRLICTSKYGFPPPKLRWMINGKYLEDKGQSTVNDITSTNLTLENMTREYLRAQISCQASNNKSYQPLIDTVTIDMNLPALSITIENPPEPLSAGRTYELKCVSTGSRPPAVLTWWMDSTRIEATADQTSADGNMSTSIIKLKVETYHDGKKLSCRAENMYVPSAVAEASLNLTVYYVPEVSVVMGRGIDPSSIKENGDVYFECNVRANPKAYKIVWKHNNKEVKDRKEDNILLSGMSLVIQKVKRIQAGKYTCTASNVEGDATSTPFNLKVQYPPLCKENQVGVYGVSKLEEVHVVCELDAVPPVTQFYWSFNNTAETLTVPKGRYTEGIGGRSVVAYIPTTDQEYGTLMCSGENKLGRQKDHCLFQIMPTNVYSSQPEAPTNCTVQNISANSLSVICSEGFDGGLNQTFVMEVYSTKPHQLKDNITSNTPRFNVRGLESDTELQLIVYSGNTKGRSGITRIMAFTQKLPVNVLENRLDTETITSKSTIYDEIPILGVIFGCVLAFLVLLIGVVIFIKIICRSNNRENTLSGDTDIVGDLTEINDQKTEEEDTNIDHSTLSDQQGLELLETPSLLHQCASYSQHPSVPVTYQGLQPHCLPLQTPLQNQQYILLSQSSQQQMQMYQQHSLDKEGQKSCTNIQINK